MLGKRIAASVLSAAVTFGSFSTLAQLPAAATDAGDEIAQKGLWITELYQNDVNRSKNSNTREENGYTRFLGYTKGLRRRVANCS